MRGAEVAPVCWALMEMLLLLLDHTVSQLPGHGEGTRTQVWEAWMSASTPLHLPPSRDSGEAAFWKESCPVRFCITV